MPKTKILFVHHTTAVGGATNSMLFTIQGLSRDEFDIEVLFLQKPGPASPLFEKENIVIHYMEGVSIYQHADNSYLKWVSRKPWLPVTRYFQINNSAKKLDSFFEKSRYDIVHINTSLNIPVGIAAKRNGCKVVWHIREPLKTGLFGIRRALVRKLIINNSDKIIAISKFDASKLGGNNKTEVIYNYVDFNKFSKDIDYSSFDKELQNTFNISTETKVITTLGGTVHSKGANIFIKAAQIICSERNDVVFLIAGYGGKQNSGFKERASAFVKKIIGSDYDKAVECAQLIKKYNLESRVIFLGLRSDIPQILGRTYVLTWPATISHFARPIIEAGAMAKPSVATDFPSSREVIGDGENGLFFPDKNYKILADKINYLLDNPLKVKEMGENAYLRAVSSFNAETNIKRVIAIYRELTK